MKAFFSVLVLGLLLSACTVSPDYPSNQTYFSTEGRVESVGFDVYPAPVKHVEQVKEQFQEVCVGQWCRCESN